MIFNNKILIDIILSILPILTIFIVGRLFPIPSDIYKPIFQPPNWVFPIIWTYITLTFGILSAYAFKKTKNVSILVFYFILLGLLNSWLVINHYKLYKQGFIVLILTTYTSILYLYFLINKKIKFTLLLLPFPFWLILASCLNGVIYDRN